MATIGWIVELEIEATRTAEFEQLIRRHAANCLEKEPGGCLRFEVFRERDASNRFVLVEIYANDEALKAHQESAHMNAFREQAKDMFLSRKAHHTDLL
jgi:quinol monooxygenase YgiN